MWLWDCDQCDDSRRNTQWYARAFIHYSLFIIQSTTEKSLCDQFFCAFVLFSCKLYTFHLLAWAFPIYENAIMNNLFGLLHSGIDGMLNWLTDWLIERLIEELQWIAYLVLTSSNSTDHWAKSFSGSSSKKKNHLLNSQH